MGKHEAEEEEPVEGYPIGNQDPDRGLDKMPPPDREDDRK